MKTNVLTTDERLDIIDRNIREMNSMLLEILSRDKQDNDFDKIMDVKQAASFLGLEKHVVYAKCSGGEIPCFRVGKLYKFKKAELKKWLEEQGINNSINTDDIANKYLQKHILKG
jgi:excisionase family DNA binding protein